MISRFFQIIAAPNKEQALRAAINENDGTQHVSPFDVDVETFLNVPRAPFCYWVSPAVAATFKRLSPLQDAGREARIGASPKDRLRFVRTAWEIPPSLIRGDWVPFVKGGELSHYYADPHLLVAWAGDGAELKAHISAYRYARGWGDQWTAALNGYEHYRRPGLTWTLRTTSRLSVRVMCSGCIFSDKGPALFVGADSAVDLFALLAITNSAPFSMLAELQLAAIDAAARSYEVGVIQRTPVPHLEDGAVRVLSELALRAWEIKRALDTSSQISHTFVLPTALQVEGASLTERAGAWLDRVHQVDDELDAIQAEIDDRCFDLYGIDEADRRAINDGFTSDAEGSDADASAGEVDEAHDEQDVGAAVDVTGLVAELVSWAVGVAVGRFDVRLATGERELPGEPEPFDRLPVCSPGVLVGDDGLPATSAPSGYPLDFSPSGVLVDDPGDGRDCTAAVRAVFETVFGASADALWDEAAALLDPKGHDLRAWLRAGFFEHHLKLHSRSRRKAPILWQLGTPSGRYSVWLYAHRLTEDSLFQLQGDLLVPKLAYEDRQLTSLVQSFGGNPSAKERREIEAQEAFVEELRVLLEEVKRVAPLWKPTLDDGTVLVMAPLWRLVPYKPWQRELKKKWAELDAGKYDWAKLAMHLWPERVVPKCADDRSLAIAHGLEDVFWVEDEDGKWQPREKPTVTPEGLIQQRTSTAIKDALGVAP
jgi:hypothetical protein